MINSTSSIKFLLFLHSALANVFVTIFQWIIKFEIEADAENREEKKRWSLLMTWGGRKRGGNIVKNISGISHHLSWVLLRIKLFIPTEKIEFLSSVPSLTHSPVQLPQQGGTFSKTSSPSILNGSNIQSSIFFPLSLSLLFFLRDIIVVSFYRKKLRGKKWWRKVLIKNLFLKWKFID